MATFGRVLLWTLVLVAPGGFLLVPVLAAATLHGGASRSTSLREQLQQLVARLRWAEIQRYWTKS